MTERGDGFLSGRSGTLGRRSAARAELLDRADDLYRAAQLEPLRLAQAARRAPPRRSVLAVGVELPRSLMESARAELERSRHDVEISVMEGAGGRGKFENLNELLADFNLGRFDWLIALDDDVELPRGFLDRFLFLAERFDLSLVQPAHRRRSQASHPVTRRRAGSVARETAFVEIGPLTAFAARTFETLLPFPPLRMGWGLDAHWSAVAREQRWHIGVVDATPIRHRARPIASGYSHAEAIAEGREFLAGRPFVHNDEAARTLVAHRSW